MTNLLSLLWIAVTQVTPVLLFFYFLLLSRQTYSKVPDRTTRILGYFSGILSIMYIAVVVCIWVYGWVILKPDTSPATSFTPTAQRWLFIAFYVSVAFVFLAPVVAAFIATYRSRLSSATTKSKR